jgi:hypothetical protein
MHTFPCISSFFLFFHPNNPNISPLKKISSLN